MKISFTKTETRTLRDKTEQRFDVECEFSIIPKGMICRIWKATIKKICEWFNNLW
jgi:hypothetical protein